MATARQPQTPENPKIVKLPIGSSILYLINNLPAPIAFKLAMLPMITLEVTPTLLQEAVIATRPDRAALKMPCGS